MDVGHHNCRDYYVSPHFPPISIAQDLRPTLHRDESYEELMERSRSPASVQSKFPLLRLPLELRQLILSYILPRTAELVRAKASTPTDLAAGNRLSEQERRLRTSVRAAPINHIVWIRGNINTMLACSQLHQECAEMIYGSNTFLLFLTYPGIHFRFRWLMPQGLAPTRNYPFLELMPARYLNLIRKVIIHIDHVDSYTSMIKYNVGGRGLIHGLRKQAVQLVQALQPRDAEGSATKHLSRVVVRISTANAVVDSINSRKARDGDDGKLSERELMQKKLQAKDIQDVLEPFGDLMSVHDVQIFGTVAHDFANALEAQMRSSEPRVLHACCATDEQVKDTPQLCVYGNDMS